MTVSWNQYQKMLEVQVEETKINMEYAEKQFKQSKIKYDIAVKGLDSFKKLLEEKLGEIEE